MLKARNQPRRPPEVAERPLTPRYELEADGAFRIDHYHVAPALCSFLPGLGGLDGVPLWCLYVNRAQAVVSFGVQDKDHALAEFLPATWAYQLVGLQGFRTLCLVDGTFYEPLGLAPLEPADGTRSLCIRADRLELSETNTRRGLRCDVAYFSVVHAPLGALVRQVRLTNTGSAPRRVTLLDGLPIVVPAGLTDHGLKALRHIHEAYASVRLTCGHVPYYMARVAAHDEAEVVRLTSGNFYAAWVGRAGEWTPTEPYVDPHLVFGPGQDLVTPRLLIARGLPDRNAQVWENRLPCALVPATAVLDPGASVEVFALAGQAPHEDLLAQFLARFRTRADFVRAAAECARVVDDAVAPGRLVSGVPALDAYARQNFLDNLLRGGEPHLLPSRRGPAPVYVYARRHGDLERDYNHFVLPAHPLSGGSGNFRDICQNRRWDVWFYPQVQDREIRMFLSLLQADGYNPLAVAGYRWRLAADAAWEPLCPAGAPAARAEFRHLLEQGCQPGELLHWAAVHGVTPAAPTEWLARVLAECETTLVAHGHDGGYWIDHWTYITDLLEAFAAVYPDRVPALLTETADIGWFDEGAFVRPRAEKYALRSAGPLQIHAVADGAPAPRPLPPVTVLGKLLALVAVKAVSFDYTGRGLEMEAGRPGWNDSLNGLPGLFGSSTCEAAELARLAAWLRAALPALPDTAFPAEIAEFIARVHADLHAPEYSWDRAAGLREALRARLRDGASGAVRAVRGDLLTELLTGAERRARAALDRSIDPQTGLLHTYYINEPAGPAAARGARPADGAALAAGLPPFTPRPLPLYLEGQVHWLRLTRAAAHARAVYRAVRHSPLFDGALQMYKLNACLADCPPEIGRARTFTRGWFENESIWLHMSYKYLLELVRCGLFPEFYADARTMLVPFMDPAVYGRSTLENCSFLGSSANPDRATHGRGFIARLSGSTAEFIHILLLLTVGPAPFFLDGGELRFGVRPALPGAWFTTGPARVSHAGAEVELPANTLACMVLGTILLVYHNAARRDTFGPAAVRPVRYALDGVPAGTLTAGDAVALGAADAERIRQRACRRIDVWLE